MEKEKKDYSSWSMKELTQRKGQQREEEKIKERKMNYWRGFRSGVIITVAVLVVALNIFIAIYG